MERKKPTFEGLRARLEQWFKLYPRDGRLLGAVPKSEVDAGANALGNYNAFEIYFLRCGNCGNEEVASRAEAILHHRVGDPTFLCSACSEAYNRRARQMLREHLSAPAHVRSAWNQIQRSGGRGKLSIPPERPPKTGDPVRN